MLLTGLDSLIDLLTLAALIVKVFAFIDTAIRRPEAFVAAGKQSKNFWLIFLGVFIAADLLRVNVLGLGGGIFGLLGIIGLIGAIVYVVDVRPAVREVGRGGGRNTGPYGPW